jgi:hypothetical protein
MMITLAAMGPLPRGDGKGSPRPSRPGNDEEGATAAEADPGFLSLLMATSYRKFW